MTADLGRTQIEPPQPGQSHELGRAPIGEATPRQIEPMKVGEHFNDFAAQFEMTFGGKTTKGSGKYTDRTVADQETITTPAGSWTSFKITYNIVVTITGFNAPPSTTKVTEWYVPNLGVVQTQIGAQMGSMTLKVTSIKG